MARLLSYSQGIYVKINVSRYMGSYISVYRQELKVFCEFSVRKINSKSSNFRKQTTDSVATVVMYERRTPRKYHPVAELQAKVHVGKT